MRSAHVGHIRLYDLSLSSILQVGDHQSFTPTLKALAVQRRISHDRAGEAYFESYPIFARPFPDLSAPLYSGELIEEPNTITIVNEHSDIKLGQLHITAVSASSLIQAGNQETVIAEARIKHIRQFSAKAAALSG